MYKIRIEMKDNMESLNQNLRKDILRKNFRKYESYYQLVCIK